MDKVDDIIHQPVRLRVDRVQPVRQATRLIHRLLQQVGVSGEVLKQAQLRSQGKNCYRLVLRQLLHESQHLLAYSLLLDGLAVQSVKQHDVENSAGMKFGRVAEDVRCQPPSCTDTRAPCCMYTVASASQPGGSAGAIRSSPS